jgi:hypothetical protein
MAQPTIATAHSGKLNPEKKKCALQLGRKLDIGLDCRSQRSPAILQTSHNRHSEIHKEA